MARQSFGKRENEKKKQAKRLEKQKRREERQAGGTRSPEDMIAYVDENGNIVSTPPEERTRHKIRLEDVSIATPKRKSWKPNRSKAVWNISMTPKDTVLSRIWPRPRNTFSISLLHRQKLPKEK